MIQHDLSYISFFKDKKDNFTLFFLAVGLFMPPWWLRW